mmetsp:Transcript_50634/g.103046  ORF Transcript_50634/g.103046 Transcript_50634/m.103046 type:complete len:220 (+) Transcript_50634:290-949(+)
MYGSTMPGPCATEHGSNINASSQELRPADSVQCLMQEHAGDESASESPSGDGAGGDNDDNSDWAPPEEANSDDNSDSAPPEEDAARSPSEYASDSSRKSLSLHPRKRTARVAAVRQVEDDDNHMTSTAMADLAVRGWSEELPDVINCAASEVRDRKVLGRWPALPPATNGVQYIGNLPADWDVVPRSRVFLQHAEVGQQMLAFARHMIATAPEQTMQAE